MAKNEVSLQIEQEIGILNKNIVFPVKRDGKAFGRLRISKGGIDWMGAGAQKKHHHLTWDRVAELLREHGTEFD